MSLTIIKLRSSFASIVWVAASLLVVGFGFVSARSFFLDTLATRLDIRDPAAGPIVDALTDSAANYPSAHLLAGVYYEKTFDVADLDRSLAEYERAAQLDPANYNLWLAVAEARDRIGDADGAGVAFSRASELAPNYADVQWAYGNFLLRQRRGDEAFPLIAKSASSNADFAGPAVGIVIQMTGGDVAQTRDLLGRDPAVDAALTNTLSSQKRYGDALQMWSAIPLDLRQDKYRQAGQDLMNVLLAAQQYRGAAIVAADLAADDLAKPAIGQVMNGGFENGVKLRLPGPFEWQIGDGAEPQIGLSEAQKHGGRYGLTIVFNTFRPEGYRGISQLLAVEPGARYRLDAWYKSNLKTEAKYQWQLIDAATSKALGTTGEMSPNDTWTSVSAEFSIPADSDGVKLVLLRTGCTSAGCPASGTIAFDDISLTKE